MNQISDFILHAALGMIVVICIPMAVIALPFWLIGKLVGARLERQS